MIQPFMSCIYFYSKTVRQPVKPWQQLLIQVQRIRKINSPVIFHKKEDFEIEAAVVSNTLLHSFLIKKHLTY